ncbi:MAG: nucleotidyltransferase family protein [Chloroflexi bacterium]|nr:nucleotidyltransferase family protein [Chloroflexota bacterium]MCL5109038.1 nucleotidyltransferase family protein [Chloroflexota bacterium]
MSDRPFPVAILAGGLATRLRPLTETIPKALVDVNGEAFIAHQLRLLRANGIERVVVCAGYRGEMIQELLGDGARFGLRVEFSFDGPRLLGTAGAINAALPLLGESFFVLYGDSYLPCDYRRVQRAFQESGSPAMMTVFRNACLWDTSNVEFVDGRIVAYDKRNRTPRMQYIDYGLGVFSQIAFEAVPRDEPYDLAALYQHVLSQGKLATFEVTERFYEIGSFEGLEETRRYLALQAQARKESIV